MFYAPEEHNLCRKNWCIRRRVSTILFDGTRFSWRATVQI